MPTTRAGKRARADSPISTAVDNAPPPSKRAATSSKADPVADLGNSDNELLREGEEEDEVSSSDELLEEEEELSPEEIDAAIMDGDMVGPEEDPDMTTELIEDSVDEDWVDEVAEDELPLPRLDVELGKIVIDEANVERFCARIRHIIMALQTLARSIPGSDFWGTGSGSARRPITRMWWVFLCKADMRHLLDIYQAAVPKHVQTVLGQSSFGLTDLLSLVGNWQDLSWGVYLDLLTKGTLARWFQLYVGSATSVAGVGMSKCGFWKRIQTYFNWVKNRIFPDRHAAIIKTGSAHGKAVLDPEVQIQFVKLARFSKDVPRCYIHLFETLMMVYLGTFRSGYVSTWTIAEAYVWEKQCRPDDLPSMDPAIGLNRAWPVNQPTMGRSNKDRVCCICDGRNKRANGKSAYWFHLDPSKPYMAMMCQSRHAYRQRNGRLPDADGVNFRRRRLAYCKQKRSFGNWKCDDCKQPLTEGSSRYLEEDGEPVVACSTCLTARGLVLDSRKREPRQRIRLRAQPGYQYPSKQKRNGPCVSCGTTTRPTQPQTSQDGKLRCSTCRCSLDKRLATFDKGPIKRKGRAKTTARTDFSLEARLAILANYSRSEFSSSSA